MVGGAGAERFDLVVIGSGPAGEKAATQAAYHGKRVAIVERARAVGGVPVRNGGIPSKTLREAALYLTGYRAGDAYGVHLGLDPETTLASLRRRASEVVATMSARVLDNIERHGIVLVHGTATLAAGRRVEVALDGERRRVLGADVVLVATGSRPSHPPGIPFEDPGVHDSETILEVDRPFASAVVLGGGPVGCEYASVLAALGVETTLVERDSRLVPFLDAELARLLAGELGHGGVTVVVNAGEAAVRRRSGRLEVALGTGEVLRPDKVLFAGGRSPVTAGLGLEAAGVALDGRGRVVVDERFETTAPGIFAAGDVLGPPALASIAMEQGRVAMCHAFAIPFKLVVDSLPPVAVYSIPEVAGVGLTEEQAAETGLPVEVGRAWFAHNARATISSLGEGLVKLVFDAGDHRLLGAHVLGEAASELVHIGQLAIHGGARIDDFIHLSFNVPTRSEAYKYAAYDGLTRLERRSGGPFLAN